MGRTIPASSEPGIVPGFDITADPIPVASGLGLLPFIALIALLGARVLSTTRV